MANNWTLSELVFSSPLESPIQVAIYYAIQPSSNFTLIATGITVNTDGTLSPAQTISVEYNTYYSILAVDLACGDQYQENIYLPCSQQCAPGYMLSSDGTYCYKNITTPATPPTGGTAATAVASPFQSYSTCGSYIFSPGFNVNGTGTASQIPTSNPFWVNGAGTCVDATTTQGPMNRGACWISTVLSNQTVGFSVCLNIPTTTTYYVGVGCDNYAIINLDGVNILTQDPTALYGQFPMAGPNAATFKVWSIYPVVIQAGAHVLELIGYNVSGPAAFAAEVYDNTPAQIENATSYSGLNLIFSTKNLIGQPIDIGSGGFGYTCPPNYSLSACGSPPNCVQQVTSPPIC